MLSSFRNRLLIAFLLILGAALVAIISVVSLSTSKNASQGIQNQHQVYFQVFENLLQQNAQLHQEQLSFLVNDYDFRYAVATRNIASIQELTDTFAGKVNALTIILINNQKELQLGDNDILDNIPPLIIDGLSTSNAHTLTVFNNTPAQVIFSPIEAPDLKGWLGVGFAIEKNLLDNFKQATQTDITLRYQQNQFDGELTTSDVSAQSNEHIITTSELFTYNNISLSATLISDENLLVNNTSDLSYQITLILLATIGIGAASIYFISKGVLKPLHSYSRAAVRIARGDYSESINDEGAEETRHLGKSLNLMRQAINDREKHISYQANNDMLTAIPNRYFLGDLIKDILQEKASDSPFSIAIVHIFNFNQLNDLYGSDICDQLIKRIAQTIQLNLKMDDKIARLDGNQFLVYFDNCNEDDITVRCDEILHMLNQTFQIGPISVRIEVRIGAANYPEHGKNYDELMRRAGIALTASHIQKSDLAIYRQGQDEIHLRKIKITNRLQEAIKSGGFQLLYQPQFDLELQQINRAEALIRWHDPELEDVPPDEFIPLAERSGDISAITRWVLDRTIEQILHWRRLQVSIGVSINLSARDVKNTEFIESIIQTIADNNLKCSDFVFEVTESAVMEDSDTAISNLQKLQTRGIHVAMDDFGTGFSSLSQLKTMPISELKLDKSFILNICDDHNDQKIVKTTIEMAHHLNLKVIAEGVENVASMNLLREMGCDIIQGYHLSEPLNAEDFQNWLHQSSSSPILQTNF